MKKEALMPITEVMPKPATRENLFGRRATVKGNVRVEADGDVDELNSTIGVVRALMRSWSKIIHLPIDGKRNYAGCRYVCVVGVRRASGSDSRTVPEPS